MVLALQRPRLNLSSSENSLSASKSRFLFSNLNKIISGSSMWTIDLEGLVLRDLIIDSILLILGPPAKSASFDFPSYSLSAPLSSSSDE